LVEKLGVGKGALHREKRTKTRRPNQPIKILQAQAGFLQSYLTNLARDTGWGGKKKTKLFGKSLSENQQNLTTTQIYRKKT